MSDPTDKPPAAARVEPVRPPCLDHVSLAAERARIEALGFELTASAGGPGHARVHLDRAYLEVAEPPAGRGLAAGGWFLRVADLDEAAGRLRAAGLAAAGPTPYKGVDGSWLDLTLGGDQAPWLPTLTRRLDLPAEIWPPPLSQSHPNGATGLAGIRLRLADPAPLTTALLALGAEPRGAGLYALGAGATVALEPARALGSDGAAEGIAGLLFSRSAVAQKPGAEGGEVGGGQPAAAEDRFEIDLE